MYRLYWELFTSMLCKGLANEERVKEKKSSVACRYSDDLFVHRFPSYKLTSKKKRIKKKKNGEVKNYNISGFVKLWACSGLVYFLPRGPFPSAGHWPADTCAYVFVFLQKHLFWDFSHRISAIGKHCRWPGARTLLSPTVTAGRHAVFSGCGDRGTRARARYIRFGAPCTCATESTPVCDVRASVNHDWIGNFIRDGNLLYGRWLPGAERFKN